MQELTLYIDNNSTFIDPTPSSDVYKKLKKTLGYRPEDAIFRRQRQPYWDGIESTVCHSSKYCKCSIKKKGTHFPSGLLSKAKEVLKECQVPFNIVDSRSKAYKSINISIAEGCSLYDYQQEIIDTCVLKTRGIVKLATGGGKTIVASGLIAALGVVPFIFYVTSNDLLKQAYDEFTKWLRLNGSPLKVGRVGGGFRDIQDITVMTVQTAVRAIMPPEDPKKKKGKKKKLQIFEGDDDANEEEGDELGEYREKVKQLIQSCKGMICDEVQHWASKTCQLIADNSINCFYRFGFSATPWRDMGDDILIDSCFGKAICDINASFLIDRGFLVQPTIHFVPVENMHGIEWDTYAEAYKEGIVENDVRNNYIANIAKNLANDGRQVLVLVKHIAHGETLEKLIEGSMFIHGSHSAKERESHLALMRERKAGITIASSIFDEGVDVRPLDALILGGGGKSMTRALQRVGRVIRRFSYGQFVKRDAVVVDFNDKMQYVDKHVGKRKKIYRSEPRFIVKDLIV